MLYSLRTSTLALYPFTLEQFEVAGLLNPARRPGKIADGTLPCTRLGGVPDGNTSVHVLSLEDFVDAAPQVRLYCV